MVADCQQPLQKGQMQLDPGKPDTRQKDQRARGHKGGKQSSKKRESVAIEGRCILLLESLCSLLCSSYVMQGKPWKIVFHRSGEELDIVEYSNV